MGSFLAGLSLTSLSSAGSTINFERTFRHYVSPLQRYIFAPFFFASIGYTIPFLDLWTGRLIWRGVVYALLMILGKFLVGAVILVPDLCTARSSQVATIAHPTATPMASHSGSSTTAELSSAECRKLPSPCPINGSGLVWRLRTSFPPAAFLGTALVARGEIGVSPGSSLSRTSGGGVAWRGTSWLTLLVLPSQVLVLQATRSAPNPLLDEEAYLIAIWAVALATIVGPIGVNQLVKRYGGEIVRGRWGSGQGCA